ncbi:transcriptional regulator, MarR family [Lentilactobacillus kisonensis F0435]|nr:transcriptional regulator, MarR family [Lentilactobacillus kisonensis F0435]
MAAELNLAVSPDAVHLFLDFQLTYREIEKNYEHLVESFDLSESRFIILMFLFYADDKALLPSEIATKLGVTKPTISKLLKGMQQQDLVTSHSSTEDKRVRYIQLTTAGEQLLRTFLPYNYRSSSLLFEDFSATEMTQFSHLLRKLLKAKDKIQKLEEEHHANQ